MKFSIVAAVDEKNGLSKNGVIPWYIHYDLLRFKDLTTFSSSGRINAVIMGRVTRDSLKNGFLPGRKNIVISSKLVEDNSNILVAKSLDDALMIADRENVEKVFHIGGSKSYHDAIIHSECKSVYLTRVQGDFSCDTFFPDISSGYKMTSESNWLSERSNSFKFLCYNKV